MIDYNALKADANNCATASVVATFVSLVELSCAIKAETRANGPPSRSIRADIASLSAVVKLNPVRSVSVRFNASTQTA